MTRRIITSYFRVPGPAPQFDWTAHYEGTEETGPYGSGADPQAAINDLVDNYEAENEVEGVLAESSEHWPMTAEQAENISRRST